MLETPEGNPLKSREYTWDDGQVVLAYSWWSRFVNCVRSRSGCGWNTVFECWNGSWTGFLWCMLRTCGWGIAKCSGCATCDCRWWCKWATGCCRD
jgi:hypothetical protein